MFCLFYFAIKFWIEQSVKDLLLLVTKNLVLHDKSSSNENLVHVWFLSMLLWISDMRVYTITHTAENINSLLA